MVRVSVQVGGSLLSLLSTVCGKRALKVAAAVLGDGLGVAQENEVFHGVSSAISASSRAILSFIRSISSRLRVRRRALRSRSSSVSYRMQGERMEMAKDSVGSLLREPVSGVATMDTS